MLRDTQTREGMAEVEWTLEAARSGAPTLRIGGQQIHSAYDPLREAATRAREIVEEMGSAVAQQLILVGIGLGYLVEELQQRFAGEILVWDPFPELTRSLRLDRRSQRPGVTITSSYDAIDAALTHHLEGSRLRVFPHPGYSELARFELRWLQSSLRRNNPRFHPPGPAEAIVSPRALDALARLPELGNLMDLSGCLRGQTAIIVAPGPSLGDSLDALAERRGGALLAAMQAQRTLQEAGARVDFAVAPDPLHSLPFLEGFEPNFDALLAECSAEPALLDRWRSRTRIFPLVSNPLYDVVWRSLGLPPFDEPFNTVFGDHARPRPPPGRPSVRLRGGGSLGARKGAVRGPIRRGPAGAHEPRLLPRRAIPVAPLLTTRTRRL